MYPTAGTHSDKHASDQRIMISTLLHRKTSSAAGGECWPSRTVVHHTCRQGGHAGRRCSPPGHHRNQSCTWPAGGSPLFFGHHFGRRKIPAQGTWAWRGTSAWSSAGRAAAKTSSVVMALGPYQGSCIRIDTSVMYRAQASSAGRTAPKTSATRPLPLPPLPVTLPHE